MVKKDMRYGARKKDRPTKYTKEEHRKRHLEKLKAQRDARRQKERAC